jgi:hypothetical protein
MLPYTLNIINVEIGNNPKKNKFPPSHMVKLKKLFIKKKKMLLFSLEMHY